MITRVLNPLMQRVLCLAVLLVLAGLAICQTTPGPAANGRGVIRLRVRVAVETPTKARGLSRKRFFLIKGTKEENKALLQSFEQRAPISRDCYYRGIGASEALLTWLRQSDCESVYCREVEQKDTEGAAAVPEFQRAMATASKDYGKPEVARKWLAVSLPDNLRSGFYKRQQQDLLAFIKQAEQLSKTRVLSVMTDRNGTAYFTDLEPGNYVVSNILPTEVGDKATFWNCDVKVKPGDLATEKPILISNPENKDPRDIKNIKCVAIEKPLPVCPAPAR
jgi:hypothetical protein